MNMLVRSNHAKASRNSAGKPFLYAAHIAMLIRMKDDREFLANLSATRRELVMDLLEYDLMEMDKNRTITTSKAGADMILDLCLKLNALVTNSEEN